MRKHLDLINPANDFCFKRIFGGHEDIFKNFLMTAIDWPFGEIDDLGFVDKDISKDRVRDKEARLDVLAILKDGTFVNIEVQINRQDHFVDRTLFYWAKLYEEQLESGDSYGKLRPVVIINVLTKSHPAITEEEPYNSYTILNKKTHSPLTDKLSINMIELSKFRQEWVDNDPRNNWYCFLKSPEVVDMHTQRNPELSKALEQLKWLSQDPNMRSEYNARCKALRDKEEDLSTAMNEGIEIGTEKGIEIGTEKGIGIGAEKTKVENAMTMLKKSMAIELVSECSGLPLSTVEKLFKELQSK